MEPLDIDTEVERFAARLGNVSLWKLLSLLIALPVTVTGIAAGLIYGFGFGAWSAWGPLVAFLWMIAIIVYLKINSDNMRRRVGESRASLATTEAQLARYASAIVANQRRNPNYFVISKWREKMVVTRDGDTRITKATDIRAGGEGVDVFFMAVSATDPVSVDRRILIERSISVRKVLPDGSKVRLTWDPIWEGDKNLRLLVHLDPRLDAVREMSIEIQLDWPRYSQSLVRGNSESMDWTFTRQVEDFEYILVLESACGIGSKPSVDVHPPALTGVVRTTASDGFEICLTGNWIAPNFNAKMIVDPDS